MAQKYCHQIGEWIEDNVSQQVQQCVERKCKWWCACCNKWFCFLVWVVVTVVKWVVQTVCEIIGDVFDLLVAIVTGGWDILAGLLTGDWGRVWDGFLEIVGAAGGVLGDFLRAAFAPCGLFGVFRDSVNKWRLRGYVAEIIDQSRRFSPDERAQIREAIGLDGGGFGLRLTLTSYRGYVRSDFTEPGESTPALIRWHNDPDPNPRVDLKSITGHAWTAFLEMSRPEVRGDDGDISESDLDDYLAGMGRKSFSVYAVSDADLLERVHCIQTKGDTIGLKFVVDLQDVELTLPTQVRAKDSGSGVVENFATSPFLRPPANDPRAAGLLCAPVVLATFLFRHNPWGTPSASATPMGSTGSCGAKKVTAR